MFVGGRWHTEPRCDRARPRRGKRVKEFAECRSHGRMLCTRRCSVLFFVIHEFKVVRGCVVPTLAPYGTPRGRNNLDKSSAAFLPLGMHVWATASCCVSIERDALYCCVHVRAKAPRAHDTCETCTHMQAEYELSMALRKPENMHKCCNPVLLMMPVHHDPPHCLCGCLNATQAEAHGFFGSS